MPSTLTQPCSRVTLAFHVFVPTKDPGEGFGVRQRVLLGTEMGRAQNRVPGPSVGKAGVWTVRTEPSQHQLHPPVGREASYSTLPPGRPETWGVGQNCYLPGPGPGSLSGEALFAPTCPLWATGRTPVSHGAEQQPPGIILTSAPPDSLTPGVGARLGKKIWQSHCHH